MGAIGQDCIRARVRLTRGDQSWIAPRIDDVAIRIDLDDGRGGLGLGRAADALRRRQPAGLEAASVDEDVVVGIVGQAKRGGGPRSRGCVGGSASEPRRDRGSAINPCRDLLCAIGQCGSPRVVTPTARIGRMHHSVNTEGCAGT